MADAVPAKKTRKSSGPRQQRPVFALVRYTNAEGEQMQLNKEGLSIQIERDSGKIVELLTSGTGAAGATVVRIELPQPTARKAADASA